MSGKVYLVGGGPGDPELLTVKAVKILSRANIVLHDALVSREVLALIAPSAELIDVGKRAGRKLLTQEEINSLLVSYAESHEIVVRLKGGDPLIFGRAGEEMAALREANIGFEIVPGITAGLGAAAAAGISLTDRRYASQVLFTTMQRDTPNRAIQWAGISSTTTLVIYMPGPDYGHVAEQLRDASWPLDMPCAIISHATVRIKRFARRIWWTWPPRHVSPPLRSSWLGALRRKRRKKSAMNSGAAFHLRTQSQIQL